MYKFKSTSEQGSATIQLSILVALLALTSIVSISDLSNKSANVFLTAGQALNNEAPMTLLALQQGHTDDGREAGEWNGIETRGTQERGDTDPHFNNVNISSHSNTIHSTPGASETQNLSMPLNVQGILPY